MRPDHVVLAVATPLATGGLYLLFAGETSLSEAVALAVVVILTCLYAYGIYRVAARGIRLQAGAVPAALRAVWAILPDTLRVGRALLAAVRERPPQAEGMPQRQPFRFGDDTPEDAGRRATAILALSLAPNGYVLDFEDNGDALMHRLRPAPASADREWPA